jgi:hypothetical protein
MFIADEESEFLSTLLVIRENWPKIVYAKKLSFIHQFSVAGY